MLPRPLFCLARASSLSGAFLRHELTAHGRMAMAFDVHLVKCIPPRVGVCFAELGYSVARLLACCSHR